MKRTDGKGMKNQEGFLWGRIDTSQGQEHQETLTTAQGPLMNLNDYTDVYIVITVFQKKTSCTFFSEYM